MSDLVSRLRHWARIASAEDPDRTPAEQMLYWEAADEIERLQTLLDGSCDALHPKAEEKPRQEPELVEDGEGETTWHYLPVYVEYEGERTYSLCEVYIRDGKLTGWTDAQISPIGDSPEDLAGSLERMLDDARHWKPVRFDELKAGMVLEASTP